jgi:hypothetical protein
MSGAGLVARNQAAHIAGATPEPDAQHCATVAEALRRGWRMVPVNLTFTCLCGNCSARVRRRAAIATSNLCRANLGRDVGYQS